MSLFTNWACFDCKKNFRNFPQCHVKTKTLQDKRKCPQCARPMWDMGVYFEPPRQSNKKAWISMQLLAENGYRFDSEGSSIYIRKYILTTQNPRTHEVRSNIAAEKQTKYDSKLKAKIDYYKEAKRHC